MRFFFYSYVSPQLILHSVTRYEDLVAFLQQNILQVLYAEKLLNLFRWSCWSFGVSQSHKILLDIVSNTVSSILINSSGKNENNSFSFQFDLHFFRIRQKMDTTEKNNTSPFLFQFEIGPCGCILLTVSVILSRSINLWVVLYPCFMTYKENKLCWVRKQPRCS